MKISCTREIKKTWLSLEARTNIILWDRTIIVIINYKRKATPQWKLEGNGEENPYEHNASRP